MKVKPLTEPVSLPWGVFDGDRLVAAFEREWAAVAYRIEYERAMKKVMG